MMDVIFILTFKTEHTDQYCHSIFLFWIASLIDLKISLKRLIHASTRLGSDTNTNKIYFPRNCRIACISLNIYKTLIFI